MSRPIALILSFLTLATLASADGPADNDPKKVGRIPKLGVEVSPADRKELELGLADLDGAIAKLKAKNDKKTAELLPDVQIYAKAVHDALKYQEFFDVKDIAKAKILLKAGQGRASDLLEGKAPWTEAIGLVVRGYVSKIDDSVQPFGLVVPPNYTARTSGRYRLDLWFHGRGETLSEVNFLNERQTQAGTITPVDTIVLHPYGRYCNASKFAGEVDAFEALEAAKRMYRVDNERIAVRGFSMGGASAWHLAVHYPDVWFAANPGAGFAETPRFLKVFQNEKLEPTWYEQKLWSLYDCDKWSLNLLNCPTVAYSGELDNQKQAADVMAESLKTHDMELTHIIGPKTKHQYHPAAKIEVEARLAELALNGRERTPERLDFATYTLRYNRTHWITVDAVGEHWAEATVRARILYSPKGTMGDLTMATPLVVLGTRNVQALTVDFKPGTSPFRPGGPQPMIMVDGLPLTGPDVGSDLSLKVHFAKVGKAWEVVPGLPVGAVKRHGLQGPIDDAFMSRFLVVLPTGKGRHPKVDLWVKAESERAIEHWRRHFRGEARVKKDVDVTDADIADSNLILWGDPESNAILKKLADRLAIRWGADAIAPADNGKTFASPDHALILIQPNPLNVNKYVVLNSGFTFRDYDYLNNARQVPKLPDWAVIDLNTAPNTRTPGKVVAADFFDESWKVKATPGGSVPK